MLSHLNEMKANFQNIENTLREEKDEASYKEREEIRDILHNIHLCISSLESMEEHND